MSKSFPITGIPVNPRYRLPERQDVDRWLLERTTSLNAYQLSLFVRALSVLMSKDPKDDLSFFAIAGIHGEPICSWDGVREGSSDSKIFCSHANPTFPTWHRPYLLLIEQVIHTTMKDILRPHQTHRLFSEWKTAADTWRFPYWDWATSRLPDIVVFGKSIPIRKLLSETEDETVLNPFWQFNIPGARATSKWAVTKSGTPTWKDGIQNWGSANLALANPCWPGYEWRFRGSIADAVERLFSPGYHISWESFASTAYRKGKVENMGFMNLEYIHNNIHNWTGGLDTECGAGHMSTLEYSAFDALFWLHHCNVDRLTSIWLLLNPDKFFDDPQSGDPARTAPLAPFHCDTKRTAWNSNDARTTEPWNYSYDTLHHDPGQKNANYLSKIRKTINELYGQTRKDLFNFDDILGKNNDYILDIIYDRYALNGNSYTIHFFLGPVDGDPSLYSLHPNRIGILYTFSSNLEVSHEAGGEAKPKCKNCAEQKAAGVLSRGQVVLTSALLKDATDPSKPDISSLEPEDVTRYLTRNLNWKAVDNFGTEIDIERDLPQTKIFALKGVAEHYRDSRELSKYCDYDILSAPCVGKPGGVGSQTELWGLEL